MVSLHSVIWVFLLNNFSRVINLLLAKLARDRTYGLLTKCEVKMAGYWPSSFFVSVHKLAKKRTRPISSHLDRTNLVNQGFITWLLVKFCLRDTAGSPERARWLHLARSGSQSQRAIWFILPAHGARRISTLCLFCTDLAVLGPYCQGLRPIFSQQGPRAWLIRYMY